MSELSSTPSITRLSKKHMAFVDAYFSCNMNATEAYSRIFPDAKRESCRARGSSLLTNINIQSEIEKRLSQQTMGKSELLARLSAMARASTLPFIRITDEGFVYFDFSHPDAKDYMFLIRKIKTKRTRRLEGKGESAEVWEDEWVEVELHDAQSALEKIGRYHKLFVDRREVDVTSAGQKIDVRLVSDD